MADSQIEIAVVVQLQDRIAEPGRDDGDHDVINAVAGGPPWGFLLRDGEPDVEPESVVILQRTDERPRWYESIEANTNDENFFGWALNQTKEDIYLWRIVK